MKKVIALLIAVFLCISLANAVPNGLSPFKFSTESIQKVTFSLLQNLSFGNFIKLGISTKVADIWSPDLALTGIFSAEDILHNLFYRMNQSDVFFTWNNRFFIIKDYLNIDVNA